MRPDRRFELHFAHAEVEKPVKLLAVGNTPCNAKNAGWVLLERYLDVTPEYPRNGWRLAFIEDLGLL